MQIQITVDARDPHELVHFWTQALDGLDDETLFPDSALNDAIAFAEELILDYCGPWAPTSITLTFQGSRTDVVTLGVSGVRSLDTLTVNGTSAISGASVTWEGVLTLADVAYADDLIVDVEKYGRQMVLFPYSRLSWLLSDAYPDERPESY